MGIESDIVARGVTRRFDEVRFTVGPAIRGDKSVRPCANSHADPSAQNFPWDMTQKEHSRDFTLPFDESTIVWPVEARMSETS